MKPSYLDDIFDSQDLNFMYVDVAAKYIRYLYLKMSY